jgi:hypothetical protein
MKYKSHYKILFITLILGGAFIIAQSVYRERQIGNFVSSINAEFSTQSLNAGNFDSKLKQYEPRIKYLSEHQPLIKLNTNKSQLANVSADMCGWLEGRFFYYLEMFDASGNFGYRYMSDLTLSMGSRMGCQFTF